MVGIVLTSHGGFADGINQSAEMIFGQQQDVAHVILKPNEGPDDIHAKLKEAIKDFSDQEQVLFLVDLWGGTLVRHSIKSPACLNSIKIHGPL